MYKLILAAVVQLYAVTNFAQDTLKLIIKEKEKESGVAAATATISALNRSFVADSSGTILIPNLVAGEHTISISSIGYSDKEIRLRIPSDSSSITILLEQE